MPNKPTLIILHPHLTIPGGAGQFALEFGKILSQKTNVVFIAQQINPNYIDQYPQIKFISLNGPLTSSLKFWICLPYWYLKTAQVINQEKATSKIALFPQVFPATWIGSLYKIINPGVRLIMYIHEPSAFIHIPKWRNAIKPKYKQLLANFLAPFLSIIDKFLLRHADQIFANSEYGQSQIKQFYNRSSLIVYPGVNYDLFKPINFNKKENRIITACRLSKFKNVQTIIKAISMAKNKSVKLWIAGDGEYKSNLEQLTRDLNLTARVDFLGPLNHQQLSIYYSRSKLFVLATQAEPFGLVTIEALASGTPAIADNSGGPKEIIIDDKNGYLINCNASNLATLIDDLFSKPNKLKQLSLNSRTTAIEKFQWQKGAQIILDSCNF